MKKLVFLCLLCLIFVDHAAGTSAVTCNEKMPKYVLSYRGPLAPQRGVFFEQIDPPIVGGDRRYYKILRNRDCTYRQVESFKNGIRIWADTYIYRDSTNLSDRVRGSRQYETGEKTELQFDQYGVIVER